MSAVWHTRTRLSVAVFALLLVFLGCSDDPGTVFIDLDHDVSGAALTFNSFLYTNAVGDDYSVEVLKYYVSDLVLHGTDGSDYSVDVVHYRDAEDPSTKTLELSGVDGGSYDALSLTFGLDDQDNVTDGLPPTQENLNMAWPGPMGGGYHYMKLEGKFVDAVSGDTLSYATHTGRNGAIPHFFEVTLPFSTISIDGNTFTANVIMDIDEWYTNPNDYGFPTNSMIMGNIGVQDTLSENGANAFRIGSVQEN